MLRILTLFLATLLASSAALCQNVTYDIAYIWDKNIDKVLDYQQELKALLGEEESKQLKIVSRDDDSYGIIYDLDGSALESAQIMVRHNELLRREGLADCTAIDDNGYSRLYNVSYGLGPNLEALKKRYAIINDYLGEDVGKDLYIEKTDGDNYVLVYRRRGSRESSYTVARRHARLLKRKNIATAVIVENNNPTVFGESSHLDAAANEPAATSQPELAAAKAQAAEAKEYGNAGSVNPGSAAAPPVQVDLVELLPKPRKVPVDDGAVSFPAAVTNVERSIEELIKKLRRQGKLDPDESTGWMVYDLTSGKSVASINSEQIFQAASMIKPFVALAFFHQVKEGKLIYGPKSRRNMEAMIQRSNNRSTNWIMRAVGGPDACARILQSEYGHIFKNTIITEYIPAGGRTYKNKAIPSDYVRFLLALWKNELPYSKEMRRLMSLPARSRLYSGTPIPRGTLVYNKTGTTAHLCGDMGILVPRDSKGQRYPYALVGIIERRSRPGNYGNWMLTRGNVIREVSTLVYEVMKEQYHLR